MFGIKENLTKLFKEEFLLGNIRENDQYIMIIEGIQKDLYTSVYDPRILTIRRDSSFKLILRSKKQNFDINIDDINVNIMTLSKGSFKIILTQIGDHLKGFSIVSKEWVRNTSLEVIIKVDVTAGVGLFLVSLDNDPGKLADPVPLFIVFNPLSKNESVFENRIDWIKNYLLSDKCRIHCGSHDSYNYMQYYLSQFSFEAMIVTSYFLSQISYKDRTSPLVVSRAISAFVNANDDNGLLSGSWSNYEGGTHPTHWKYLKDIFSKYISTGISVKFAQCFVFAAATTSLCRNIGILTRAVTGFSVGHDMDEDGYLTIYLDKNLKTISEKSETLWNFHVFNNVWIIRKDVTIKTKDVYSISHWQHIDGTPQERSQGLFRVGPYPVEYLKRKIYCPIIPYDGPSIFYSLNGIVRYIVLDNDGQESRKFEKSTVAPLILTEGFDKRTENITLEYKSPKKSIISPSNPNKMILELHVPEQIEIGSAVDFKFSASSSAIDMKKVVALQLELRNIFGRNILHEPLINYSYIFSDTTYEISSQTAPIIIHEPCDLSNASFIWSLRSCTDNSSKLKTITKTSSLVPIISIEIKNKGAIFKIGKNTLDLEIKNCSSLHLTNIKINLTDLYTNKVQSLTIDRIKERGVEKATFEVYLINSKNKFEFFAETEYYHGVIKQIKIFPKA